MLRCVGRYRNAKLAIFVEPGEVLKNLSEAEESFLLRDSPGSFERVDEQPKKSVDAPPVHKMVEREDAARKTGERGPAEVMNSENMPGVSRRGGKGRGR